MADVQRDTMNVSSPDSRFRAKFNPEPDAKSAAPGTGGCCLVSFVLTTAAWGLTSTSERNGIISVLHRLHASNIDTFYVYYSPSAGLAMPRDEAISLLEKMMWAGAGIGREPIPAP